MQTVNLFNVGSIPTLPASRTLNSKTKIMVKFTNEHAARLKDLATEMLFNNTTISSNMGSVLNVVDLLHLTTVNTLKSIENALKKKIEQKESDEWSLSENDQAVLKQLKTKQEFVHLTIGYKLYQAELDQIEKKKTVLQAKITELKEQNKTPEEKIKELESELANL